MASSRATTAAGTNFTARQALSQTGAVAAWQLNFDSYRRRATWRNGLPHSGSR
jgi:hypothetical protein